MLQESGSHTELEQESVMGFEGTHGLTADMKNTVTGLYPQHPFWSVQCDVVYL